MNKLAIVAAAALASATFGISAAYAQTDDAFTKADANKDGGVTLEEAMAVYPTLTQDLFTKADANADGKLDSTEFTALVGLTAGVAGGDGGSSSEAAPASSSAAQ